MDTPTLTFKAARVISTELGGNVVLAGFRPTKETIKTFSEAEGSLAIIDLDDETGLWSNGRHFEVDEVTVSEDGRAMSVILSR